MKAWKIRAFLQLKNRSAFRFFLNDVSVQAAFLQTVPGIVSETVGRLGTDTWITDEQFLLDGFAVLSI